MPSFEEGSLKTTLEKEGKNLEEFSIKKIFNMVSFESFTHLKAPNLLFNTV